MSSPESEPSRFDPQPFLARTSGVNSTVTFRQDEVLFAQGDACDSLFYIQEGKVKISVLSEQGKEAIVAILSAGDFCGEGCLNGQLIRVASATAMTPCIATHIPKQSMLRMIHDQPEFSELFMKHLLSRNIRVEEDLVDQLFNSSEKRLARLLLIMANYGKEGRPEPIVPPVSQETLAEMIGTTRSRVSFFMNKFRQMGFIDYNGHLRVHSSLLGVVLHDKPQIRDERGNQGRR